MTQLVLHEGESPLDRALRVGVTAGILDADALDKLRKDAPKGIVQIAGVISTPYLQTELERAFLVLRGLVDKGLAILAANDPVRGASLLRDRGILGISREGNGRLKALRAMTESLYPSEVSESTWLNDAEFLERYALLPEAAFQAEVTRRQDIALHIEAANWLVAAAKGRIEYDGTADYAMWARTALLVLGAKVAWPKGVEAMRTVITRTTRSPTSKAKRASSSESIVIAIPDSCPDHLHNIVAAWCNECRTTVLPLLMATPPDLVLVDNTECNPLASWIAIPEMSLIDTDLHAAHASDAWRKLTAGKGSHEAMLTVLANVALGQPPKSVMSRKLMESLIARVRAENLDSTAVDSFICAEAPSALQAELHQLWSHFCTDAAMLAMSATELTAFMEGELSLAKTNKAKAKPRST